MPHMGRVSCDSRFYIARLVHNFKAVFFDDGIGQDFLGDALEFFLRLVAIPAIQIKDKKLALADVLYFGIAKSGESVLDGLALRIEDGALRHHPNVGFHGVSIAFSGRVTGWCARQREQRDFSLRDPAPERRAQEKAGPLRSK